MTKIKVFDFPYSGDQRGELIDLLKPFWGKDDNFSDEERKATYDLSNQDVEWVMELEDSDVALLPYSWNHFLLNNQKQEAVDCVKKAYALGKSTISWTSGDFGVKIPELKGLIVLRQNGHKSQHGANHHGMPVYISDPLQRHFHTDEVILRDKKELPVVGFCGQSKTTAIKNFKNYIQNTANLIKSNLGLRIYCPQPLYPSTLRRSNTLEALEQSDRVDCNFIKRDKYRAGASTKEERMKSTMEFYENIRDSDYTICLRGGGNFSVRLYETLAMGRIPIFINTDCLLPLDHKIAWKDHVVWVEEQDIKKLPDILNAYHQQHSNESFKTLQLKNRQLWKEYLSIGGFWKAELGYIIANHTQKPNK